MNIQITAEENEFFKIKTKQMGEVWIASDGENSAIGTTEENAVEAVEEAQEIVTPEEPPYGAPFGAPLENPKSNKMDLFSGTSWEGKKQW